MRGLAVRLLTGPWCGGFCALFSNPNPCAPCEIQAIKLKDRSVLLAFGQLLEGYTSHTAELPAGVVLEVTCLFLHSLHMATGKGKRPYSSSSQHSRAVMAALDLLRILLQASENLQVRHAGWGWKMDRAYV